MMRKHLFKLSVSMIMAAVLTIGGVPVGLFGTDISGRAAVAAYAKETSFFEAQGLSKSKTTSFSMKTALGDPKTGKDVKDVKLPVEFILNPEKPASKSGYKEVSATFNFDASASEKKYGIYGWYSAFDRDSGISLESAGAKQFNASARAEVDMDHYPDYSMTITVTCPKDYDGTMFYCGYENAEMAEAAAKLDIEHNSYRIDELPYYEKNGKNYYFFSGSGSKTEAKKHSLNKRDIQGSVQGAAKGTVTVGEASVSFKQEGGNALLTEDSAALPAGAASKGYSLVLDPAASPEITISMEVKEPPQGLATRIKIGLPYLDKYGEEGFLWVPLETARNGKTVTATADLREFNGAVDDFMFKGSASFEDDTVDFGKRLTDISDAKAMGVEYAVRFFGESVYQVLSPRKKFSVNIPDSMFNDDTSVKNGKLRIEDAKRLGEDLEGLLDEYKKDFVRNTRSKWPIQVENIEYKDAEGGYGGFATDLALTQNRCLMYLKLSSLDKGYKNNNKYDTNSCLMYHTLAHEMFHFIQWEYTNKALRSLWFDEATAVYYEDDKGDTAGKNTKNNYDLDALRQYNGITPATTFFTGSEAAEQDGYGRKALIEYLVKTFGDDFMPKFMTKYTVKSSGKPMEDLLTKQTGKTMAELTRDYYDTLVAKGELKGRFTEPWEICMGVVEGYKTPMGDDLYTKFEYTGKGTEKISFPLPRYGVHFVSIEPKKLPANFSDFNISLDTKDTSAILFDINGENYADVSVYRSWEYEFEDFYLDGHSYLLMVINESATHYGGGLVGKTASISVSVNDMNAEKSGSFPDKTKNMPEKFEGYASIREIKNIGALKCYDYKDVESVATVSYSESTGKMTVKITGTKGENLYSETLSYNPSKGFGTATDSSLQFEKGDYENGGNYVTLRLHDHYGTGRLYMVFEGYADTVAQEKEEKPLKNDYSGSYRSEEEPDDDHGFGVTAFRDAFNNAFNNAVISVNKDGSFSGTGSYSGSFSDNIPWNPSYSEGTQNLSERVSASVAISGRLNEEGVGICKVTGNASVGGNATGKAKSHDTGEFASRSTMSGNWSYSYTLSSEASAEMTSWENKNGDYVPALFIDVTEDVKVSGNYSESTDTVYPNTDRVEDEHENYSEPVNKDWAFSGLYIYLK
ncbi:MAG: hypothetical protein K6G83_03045 [Lachnospiraceae bacterium]|nr:hypothetical protein [Lachnospiraceae bacterium]